PDRWAAGPRYHRNATCRIATSRTPHRRAARRSCTPTAPAPRPLTGERHRERSRSHRLAARHDRRARGRALGLDTVVVETDALACEGVDARSRRAPSVNPEITPAHRCRTG